MKIKHNLTPVESQILYYLVNEMPNKEIAREMNYSQRTIEYHINKISRKLDVNTRVGIVVRAFREKLVELKQF